MRNQLTNERVEFQRNDTPVVHRQVEAPTAAIPHNDPARLQRILGNQAFQRELWSNPDGPIAGAGARVGQTPAGAGITSLENQGASGPDEEFVPLQGDAGVPSPRGDAGVPSPRGDAGVAPPKVSANLTITGNDSYADTTESHKIVKFNATWSGGSKEDYIIVNWVKGYVKHADGTPFKAALYGSPADVNFADWMVDSVDADPAYWSDGPVRWRYTVDGPNKFSATDDPVGMKKSWGIGTKARLDFKTAVYISSEVPTTTTGTISATPLSEFEPWNYYTEIKAENYVELNPPPKFDHT